MTNNTFGYGYLGPNDTASEYNALIFIIEQMISRIRTITPAKIISSTSDGELSIAGTVNVQPLVNILDGVGNATQHGTIFNLIYVRLQGGSNAVIIDPQPDDIGLALICDRDISSVVASKGIANPGSLRQFSLADGIYLGGILNGIPLQYIRFTPTGIIISDQNANQIIMSPGSVNVVTPSFQVNGTPVTVP